MIGRSRPVAAPRSRRNSMAEKECRVTASCNGVPKLLFAIRELGGGTLLLVLRGSEYPIAIGGKMHRVVEQRYSLHIDPVSGHVTVKHSLRLSDRRIVAFAAFSHENSAVRAWPVFSRLAPDLRAKAYDLKGAPSDRDLAIADYNPHAASLGYSVVAHRGQKLAASGDLAPATLARLSFGAFDISIVARTLDRPSADGALMHHSAEAPIASAGDDTMAERDLVHFMETALGQLLAADRRPARRGRLAG